MTHSAPSIELHDHEQRWLAGESGEAMELAMKLIVSAAEVSGASELVAIEMAHLNSTHYSGQMSLDFAEMLLANKVTFAVPAHSNASVISCSSPEFRPEANDPITVAGARRVMEIYEELGCSAMWTCAPYQQPEGRASLGQHVIGSESNAVGFTNTVLGARTNKYGDLLDVAGALVGRVPMAGLHTDAGRRATEVFDVSALPAETTSDPNFPHLLGVVLGRAVHSGVAAVIGIDHLTEDELKAVTSAGAASGGIGLVHIVGVTPEAPTLEAAAQGAVPSRVSEITTDMLSGATDILTSATGDEPLRAVCVGTPHFSVAECIETVELLAGRHVASSVSFIVTTSRAVATELNLRGLDDAFAESGVELVLDTCSYYPPHPTGIDGLTLTNSAKWAYYAQGMLNVPIGFASLERCVESAVAGRWIR